MVCAPRQPHRPRYLASKAHRVFFSCILLRRRCRNLRQTNGGATSTCSVSRRFTTRQLMLSLLSPEKAKGPGSSPALPGPSRDRYAATIHQQRVVLYVKPLCPSVFTSHSKVQFRQPGLYPLPLKP